MVGRRDWAAMINKLSRKSFIEKVAFKWRPARGERVSHANI